MDRSVNPHNFKLVWDSRTRVERVPNSDLLCIGVASCSGQLYAAVVDPMTSKNYTLYLNLASTSVKFVPTFKEIQDEREHRAIDDFFLKAGVFEYYYKGHNWEFPIKRIPSKNPGTKTNKSKLPDGRKPYTYGKKNKFEPKGKPSVPNWFRKKYMGGIN